MNAWYLDMAESKTVKSSHSRECEKCDLPSDNLASCTASSILFLWLKTRYNQNMPSSTSLNHIKYWSRKYILVFDCIVCHIHGTSIIYSPKCSSKIPNLEYTWEHATIIHTCRRCWSKHGRMGWAWGVGSKHGISAQPDRERRCETPTITPGAGHKPSG